MQQTRVAVVIDVPIIQLEDRINQRIAALEAERHNVEVVDVKIQLVGDEGLTAGGTSLLVLILYRDDGSAAEADADERRSTDAFNAAYSDSVH